jgi:hypothetical protein
VVNHLINLEETKLYLVVGVPNFTLHSTPSPMVAQKSLTQITGALRRTPQFQGNDFANNKFTNLAVSNSLVAEAPEKIEIRQPAPGGFAAAPELPNVVNTDAGNLHLYEVNDVDLAKGERAVINLDVMQLACGDLVTWKISDARVETATHQVAPADRAANPLIHHWLLKAGDSPLTTGPALVMKGDVALSQDMIYYTPRHSTGRYKSGNAVSVAGVAEETVLARESGSKEVNDRQSHHNGKAFWLKKEIRWVDETRELKITVTNGMTFETGVEVSRIFKGIPEENKELTMLTLGGRSDSQDQTNRFRWVERLPPGESKEIALRYTARIFTKL